MLNWRQPRFIPTCVGTTPSRIDPSMIFAVHPHLRGDHFRGPFPAKVKPGSSPPAWGPRTHRSNGAYVVRFIPTCVGTTSLISFHDTQESVHPHLRGDHCLPCPTLHVMYGSSPPAWGPQEMNQTEFSSFRFIPTCVGTTCPVRQRSRVVSVHPHLRGDHLP